MSYQLTLIDKPTFLYAIVTGENNPKNVSQYLEEVLGECLLRGRSKVLIEERLEGPRLKMLDVFEIASSGSLKARKAMEAVAFVDAQPDRDLLNFAEHVATGRGLKVKVFADVAEAEKWLLGEH